MAGTTTLTLTGEEYALIAHVRGQRHDGAVCHWCKDVAYFSTLLVAANREVKSIISG
jgi:hypothetical protein